MAGFQCLGLVVWCFLALVDLWVFGLLVGVCLWFSCFVRLPLGCVTRFGCACDCVVMLVCWRALC